MGQKEMWTIPLPAGEKGEKEVNTLKPFLLVGLLAFACLCALAVWVIPTVGYGPVAVSGIDPQPPQEGGQPPAQAQVEPQPKPGEVDPLDRALDSSDHALDVLSDTAKSMSRDTVAVAVSGDVSQTFIVGLFVIGMVAALGVIGFVVNLMFKKTPTGGGQ